MLQLMYEDWSYTYLLLSISRYSLIQLIELFKECMEEKTKEQRKGNIWESMESLDLALVNTFFIKNEDHLVTYKSAGNSSQIDFIKSRRADLKEMRECKVIPGEQIVSQHRLLCAVLRTKEAKHRRRTR